jgi:hypothetical protein
MIGALVAFGFWGQDTLATESHEAFTLASSLFPMNG